MTSLTVGKLSPGEVSHLLRFLYESSISYKIEYDNVFISELINAIEDNMINPVWLSQQGMKEILNELESYSSEKIRLFIVMVKGFDINSFNEELIPTEHFKLYCGSEWLNKNGMITKRDVVKFIEYSIEVQKLKEVDGIIMTNQWLQDLLKEYRNTIYRKEIPNLVHRFFSD